MPFKLQKLGLNLDNGLNLQAHHQKLIAMYRSLCKSYGDSVKSLGWHSRFTQEQRFWAATQGFDWETNVSVLDIGCGQGDLFGFLTQGGFKGAYVGVDFCPEMIEIAKQKFPKATFHVRDFWEESFALKADIVIGSGIFSHRVEQPDTYLKAGMRRLYEASTQQCAFNLLSTFSPDKEKLPHFFWYYSPHEVLKWAQEITPFVELKHQYLDNDFTVVLYHPAA